jgi:predicted amidohydrolase
VFDPAGRCLITYHKAHLFAVEKTLYAAGDKPAVVDTPVGKLGLTICYDLMFPHYSRKLIEMGADIIVNSTTWIHNPYQRDMWGWDTERTQGLASTRAFENVSFLAMACRTGRESINPELTFDCFGASCVVSPSGKFLARHVDGEGIAVAHVDIKEAELDKWRAIASYRGDRRPELYK